MPTAFAVSLVNLLAYGPENLALGILLLLALGFLVIGPLVGIATVSLIAILWRGIRQLRQRGNHVAGSAQSGSVSN
jgi:hypothetical protein